MTGLGLTPRMRELLVYIQTRDRCPSQEEMRAALCLRGNSTVSGLLKRLEERGHIRRLRHRARAIEVLRPLSSGLRVVFGPDHFELRAAENRYLWTQPPLTGERPLRKVGG